MIVKKKVLEKYPSAKCILSSSGYVIIDHIGNVMGIGKNSYRAWKGAYEHYIEDIK